MKKIIGFVAVLVVVGASTIARSSRVPSRVTMDELNAVTAARINAHVQKLARQHAALARR